VAIRLSADAPSMGLGDGEQGGVGTATLTPVSSDSIDDSELFLDVFLERVQNFDSFFSPLRVLSHATKRCVSFGS
jgi:hypothetical protein